MKEFFKGLNEQKVYLFGTVGFGESPKYFEVLGERFSESLHENTIKVI